MSTVLVTGANRGIGLELCRRFAARGDEVVAVCRKASPDLRESGTEIHEGIDVTNDDSVGGLAHDMAERGVSVFLLHPGMVATEMTGRQGIPPEEAAADLVARINALGPGQSGTFWHAKGDPLPW